MTDFVCATKIFPHPELVEGRKVVLQAMSAAAESFWKFSLVLYGRPGVAPALIRLQDRLGLDVNMLLYCCWIGSDGRSLTAAELAAVEAAVEPWQAQVVRPLRSLRRQLKGGFGDLPADRVEAYRKRLNELEIEGERIAQEAMAVMLHGGSDPAYAAGRIVGNLRAYLELRNVAVGGSDDTDLRAVVQACCPDAESATINAAFA
jgi:uncharacterized protein (TIGR02444 family)